MEETANTTTVYRLMACEVDEAGNRVSEWHTIKRCESIEELTERLDERLAFIDQCAALDTTAYMVRTRQDTADSEDDSNNTQVTAETH